jgi:anti-sigma regulatory factor (Ser/Thr protein kinase)
MHRVLVIEDESVARGLRETAALGECEIERCEGDACAVRHLRERAFDVVVTNPATSVREDLALIEGLQNARPGVRVIVLASAAAPDDLISALRAQVFACFTVPFDIREVAFMVANAIEMIDWRDGIEVISGVPHWLTLRVSCERVTAERLVQFMREYRSDVPDSDRIALTTAFREILLNAMEHGAGFSPDKVVEVSAAKLARAVVYHVRDPGPGFSRDDLGHAAIANAPSEPLAHMARRAERGMRPGGFGILLARKVVDELVYNERGNEVLLIKHIS